MTTGNDKESLTPMMQQYFSVRNTLADDTVLLFRLGDFYELFYKDAEVASAILDITLTRRQNYPMAGIPYHAAEAYIGRLLSAGKKVAICEQVENPALAKGIVKRKLTRILTPGTTLEDSQVDARHQHFILSVFTNKQGIHASWLDLTTGDFKIASAQSILDLLSVFYMIRPREILIPELLYEDWKKELEKEHHGAYAQLINFVESCPKTLLPDYHFERAFAVKMILETLGVLNLQGFGVSMENPALSPAGALLQYVTETLCSKPENIRKITEYNPKTRLLIDPATQRNLEIFRSTQGSRTGSLIEAMDATVSPQGSRLLESFLCNVLLDRHEIVRRQTCVEQFLDSPTAMHELRENLRTVRDMERILSRLENHLCYPREIGAIRDTVAVLPEIKNNLSDFSGEGITVLRNRIDDFTFLREFFAKALADNISGKIEDGGIIRAGYDAELDRLRGLTSESKNWISELQQKEMESTGIRSLKIKYNNAFGYFIEISKSNLSLVPEHYIRRQTTVNGERYYTKELKEKEKEILHAEEKIQAREQTLFDEVTKTVLEHVEQLRSSALALAEIDVFCGWAKLAREWNYCKPQIDDSDIIDIQQGRHPVVEMMIRKQVLGLSNSFTFVPNDTVLSSSNDQIILLTGPNMAGKSTYIRQVALIAYMAHVGAWVPADSCRLGIIDRIFSRVGASDELSRGNSTFMVEMNETANILNNATAKSLIILDEIGRGTSTYDGMSIAWAVAEYLHDTFPEGGPKTLFATHYHELTQLEKSLPRLKNFSVMVKEWNDEIIFVRQVIRGAADRSYGIQVARLAGLPKTVIERAKVLLAELEGDSTNSNISTDAGQEYRRDISERKTVETMTSEEAERGFDDFHATVVEEEITDYESNDRSVSGEDIAENVGKEDTAASKKEKKPVTRKVPLDHEPAKLHPKHLPVPKSNDSQMELF